MAGGVLVSNETGRGAAPKGATPKGSTGRGNEIEMGISAVVGVVAAAGAAGAAGGAAVGAVALSFTAGVDKELEGAAVLEMETKTVGL